MVLLLAEPEHMLHVHSQWVGRAAGLAGPRAAQEKLGLGSGPTALSNAAL